MTPGVGGRGARRRGLHHRADPRGQATAELALVLPFVGLLLLVVVQVAVVARDQVLVVHAAREAARAAAVDPDPGAARQAARTASRLDPANMGVVVTTKSGGPTAIVAVEVRYAAATDVPIAGRLLPVVTLRASAAMRAEW